ncbi:MAG TPA: DNA translocase FtsK [Candidatus Acidoferrales bacterium]|nr:DNA translocase FtsK [Candidatus Acidoferrales bacterium]
MSSRVRRKPAARTRLRLQGELVGIACLGLAVFFGIALALPSARAGFIGSLTAWVLHALFGAAAIYLPVLVALIGAIVFLEINVPQMIAVLGGAALGYFLIVCAVYGPLGGVVGTHLWEGLRWLFGVAGATIVIILSALALTVWVTNVSLKRTIGWAIKHVMTLVRLLRVRAQPAEGEKAQLPAVAAPRTLREAFNLPEVDHAEAAPAPIVPVPSYTIVDTVMPPSTPTTIEPKVLHDSGEPGAMEDDDDDDDFEDEDEELEDDEEFDDEEEEDDDEAEDAAPPAVSGEYQPAPIAAAVSADYRLPDLGMFDPAQAQKNDDATRSVLLEDTLASFGVGAKVTHIERGPAITRYELKPERGVKIARISSLADDIALALAATSVRIEAPIPGKSAVGIEVPNSTISVVAIREILEAIPQRGTIPPLAMALGKDITGRPVIGDLGKMPHLLVAGATGSGKSVCLNTIIASLLVSATPKQVQLLMIDPKRVELIVYNGIPHLVTDVVTDPRMAAGALFDMTKKMDERYERFARAGVRKIEEYNAKFPDEPLPYVVIVIDELADLMLIAPAKVETTICRLAQLARATGIHLVVATQRPSVDVITGIIKANIPSRISFAVSSQIDSRTILDMPGAERLLGRGDMLYLPIDAPKPVRVQGAFVTVGEINRLVAHWAAQGNPENRVDLEIVPIGDDEEKRNVDPLAYEAAKFIIETSFASTAQLQTRFSIGHPRAVRIMKQLEDFKVVGPHEGTKPRRILLGVAELETIAPRLGKDDSGQGNLFAQGA